jgi:hypothetical protein
MIRAWLLVLAASLMLPLVGHGASAQTVPSDAQSRELIIGTKLARPSP